MNSTNRAGILFFVACALNIGLAAFSYADAENTRDTLGVFSMVLPIVTAVITLIGWVSTMNAKRETRSVWLTAALFGTWSLGAAVCFVFFTEVDDVLIQGAAASSVILVPAVFMLIEWLVARTMASVGNKLQAAGNPKGASRALRIALALRPANSATRYLLAMMLAKGGNPEKAQPMLTEIYERGNSELDFLKVFYNNSKAVGDAPMQRKVGEALEKIEPTEQLFEDLLELWLNGDAQDMALERLNAMPDEDKDAYLDILFSLHLKKNDEQACLAVAERMATMEPAPFTTVRALLGELTAKLPNSIAGWELLCDLCVKANDRSAMTTVIDRLLQLDPQNVRSRRLLIEQLRTKDAVSEIIAQIQILDDFHQADPNDYYELAHWHFDRTEAQQALDILNTKMVVDNTAEAMCLKAKCLDALGRAHDALNVVQSALKLHRGAKPDSTLPAYLVHGDIGRDLRTLAMGLELRMTQKQVVQRHEELKSDPNNIELRFDWIALLCKSEQFSEAVIAYDDMLGKDDTLHDQVVTHLVKQLELYSNTQLRQYHVDILERHKQWDEMLEAFELLGRGSVSQTAILCKGCERILQKHPTFDKALDRLLTLIDLPNSMTPTECLKLIAAFYAAGGEHTFQRSMKELHLNARCNRMIRAEEICGELLTKHSTDVDLLSIAVEIYEQCQHFEKAWALQGQLVKLKNLPPETDTKLANLKVKMLDQKITTVRGQLTLAPNNAELLNTYGDLLHDVGKRNDAIAAYQKASHQHTEKADIYRAKYAYELLLKGPSFAEEARLAFKDVNLTPEMTPEIQDAIKSLFSIAARLITNEGQYDFALEMHKRIFRVDASYGNTVSEIDRIEGILRAKRNR